MAWGLYLFCVCAFNFTVLLINDGELFMTPGGVFWRLSEVEKFVFFVIRGMIFEVPDWLSILIYVLLRNHFKKCSVHPAPAPLHQDSEEVSEEDGGVFPAGAIDAVPEALPQMPPNPPPHDGSHEVGKVMKILRLHLATSFMKFTFCLITFVPSPSFKIILTYHAFLISSFWLPLVVVKANFHQMDNMLDTFCMLVC